MNGKRYKGNMVLLALVILAQLACVFYLCSNTRVTADGIFTYTLANTPYEFNYIDSKIMQFPGENGWFDAGILKEQFMTMSYDRFNWSGVYWHQRLDNHPLLYYSLVHLVCSLFPESYSAWYALSINIVALLLIDCILTRVAAFLFPENAEGAGALMIVAATSIISVYKLTALARMYLLLALMCLWFLWICIRLVRRSHVSLWEIYLCVLLGTQTHYYYYVYAALTGFVTILILLYDRAWLRIWRVVLSAAAGFLTSLIIFPWVVWHIVFNQMGKNTSLHMWDLATLQSYLSFLNVTALNSRGVLWMVIAVALIGLAIWKGRAGERVLAGGRRVWIVVGVPMALASMTIYTLNGAVYYYATPVYLPMSILLSLALLSFWNVLAHGNAALRRPVVSGICCVTAMLVVMNTVPMFMGQTEAAYTAYQSYLVFHQVAEDHAGADCIYVSSEEQDTLLSNLWFEFADYDEFKRASVEEYETVLADGDLTALLDGRESENAVVIYVTVDEEVPDGYTALAEYDGWKIAVIDE